MSGLLHITIAEPCDIIRRGVRSILEELAGDFAVTFSEAVSTRQLCASVVLKTPDILIAATSFAPFLSPCSSPLSPPILPQLLPARTKIVMLLHSDETKSAAGVKIEGRVWSEVISISDPVVTIREKLSRVAESGRFVRRHEPLSRREKDIVVCVVKGMTNRQIAEKLHLSHHTVGTHRRNISAKLDIHSTPGLIVYAISNDLVKLDELDRK
ncbi:MAG: LuxR C-terminal-related transcriptional regulator [Alistipes sp.]|jgi:DNA-binding NarL/FixJ family response regulator|nr:LuxR C-terminal-related transcriptional regulator [Alistipes sp.]